MYLQAWINKQKQSQLDNAVKLKLTIEQPLAETLHKNFNK